MLLEVYLSRLLRLLLHYVKFCGRSICLFSLCLIYNHASYFFHFQKQKKRGERETDNTGMRSLLVTIIVTAVVLTFQDLTCHGLPTIRPKFAAAWRNNYVRKSEPPPTSPPGCIHEGHFYPLNSVINRYYHHNYMINNMCVELYCNKYGLVRTSYIPNCS